MLRHQMLRRLPLVSPPATCETTQSYLHRLAAINYAHPRHLNAMLRASRTPSTGTRRTGRAGAGARSTREAQQATAEELSLLTGCAATVMLRALPDLGGRVPDPSIYRRDPALGCLRCTARRPGGRVVRRVKHDEPFCIRHRLWFVHPGAVQSHLSVAPFPQVLHAQRRHHRSVARHGHDRTQHAFDAAGSFIDHANASTIIGRRLDRVVDELRPGWSRVAWEDPVWRIAAYPLQVDMTVFMLHPQRRRAGIHDSLGMFWAEFACNFLDWPTHWPPYQPQPGDLLTRWARLEFESVPVEIDIRELGDLIDLDAF